MYLGADSGRFSAISSSDTSSKLWSISTNSFSLLIFKIKPTFVFLLNLNFLNSVLISSGTSQVLAILVILQWIISTNNQNFGRTTSKRLKRIHEQKNKCNNFRALFDDFVDLAKHCWEGYWEAWNISSLMCCCCCNNNNNKALEGKVGAIEHSLSTTTPLLFVFACHPLEQTTHWTIIPSIGQPPAS